MVSEPPQLSLPLLGRRNALRLLGVAALGLVAGCRPGKQRTAPTSAAPSTPAATGSQEPAATPTPTTTTTTTAAAQPTVPAQPTVSALSADQLVAQRVARAEQELLAAYDAVTVAHPELTDRLAPFRADHVAHLHGLEPGATPSTAAPSNPAPSNGAPSSVLPATAAASTPPSSPPASTAILRQLADLERVAAQARVDDVATTSGSLARFVASIGGCEAAHAALLSVAT